MRGFILLFTLHFHDEHPGGDRWLSSDKAKHFFAAAFVQSVSFSGLRTVRPGRRRFDRGNCDYISGQRG